MLIINFEGREVKGLSKRRYDETFAGEDAFPYDVWSIVWYWIVWIPYHCYLPFYVKHCTDFYVRSIELFW